MRLGESKRWAMTPGHLLDDVVDNKVSAEGLALYCIIRAYWGGLNSVYPKQETIAALTNFSLSKVKRLLKELDKTGWIIKERQPMVHGYNQYFICDEPFVKPTPTKLSQKLRKLESDVQED